MKQIELIYYYHGSRSENKIALTFDDGPNPFFTDHVLKILKKHEIKATFFLVGKWVVLYPGLVKKIILEGHLVGNHSYSHSRADFRKTDEIMKKIIGKDPKFIRAPYANLNLCCHLKKDYLKSKKIINFDVDSSDWNNLTSTEIIKRIKERIKYGSIIDLHDGSEKKEELKHRPIQMIKALPVLIKILKNNYNMVRIDELSLVPRIKILPLKSLK